MFRKFLTGLTVLAVSVTTWSVGGLAPQAEAASVSRKCAIIRSNSVGGINFTRLRVARSCNARPQTGVGGKSFLATNTLQVTYNERTSSTTQIAKTTTHELTHFVEWKTTPAMRQRLYSYLGVRTNGAYGSVPTVPGSNLAAWKQSARERLAESVVACRFGTNTFPGMRLVPRNKCGAFISTLNQAIAVSK